MRRSGKRKSSTLKITSGLIANTFSFLLKCLPAAIFVMGILFVLLQVKKSLYADSYFQVGSIKVFPRGVLSPVEYAKLERECRGQSLLNINLKYLEKLIRDNPDVKEAKIQRRLPRELEILITPRKPVVELSVSPKSEYYTLDEDGVVMAINKTPNPKLIQWAHYNYRQKKFSLFDIYKDLSLKQLSPIIRAFQETEATKNEKISGIVVDHLGEFSVKLVDGPEIRICEDPIKALKKMDAMGNFLQGSDRSNLLYMNLCLNDVVVQYKTK